MTGSDACDSGRVCQSLSASVEKKSRTVLPWPARKEGEKTLPRPHLQKSSYFPDCSGIEAKMIISSALTAPLG